MHLKFRGFLLLAAISVAVSSPAWARFQDDDDDSDAETKSEDPRAKHSVFDDESKTPQPAATPTIMRNNGDSTSSNSKKRGEDPDPNRDMLFYFPTGKTLPRDELAIGFPGQGVPDIQYGLANWLQIGAGYTLIGFTPNIRLGLIRGRRIDATIIYGAFLPVATEKPFTGQYAGGSITAGRDEFHVHMGYYWTQFFGDPFPEPPSTREGGLGFTGMDLQLTDNSKILFAVLTWTEFKKGDPPVNPDPVRVYAAAPGFRYWRGRLSVDAGLAAIYTTGVDKDSDVPPVLPMFTLRYRL